jgi:hypothetical protein
MNDTAASAFTACGPEACRIIQSYIFLNMARRADAQNKNAIPAVRPEWR